MSHLTERVAYLKGLADGMNLKPDTNEAKLLLGIVDVLDDFAKEISVLDDAHSELSEYVESIDDDLSELEEVVLEDDDDDEHYHLHDDDDDLIEFECPHCGVSAFFDAYMFDLEEDHICPHCGKSISLEDEKDED